MGGGSNRDRIGRTCFAATPTREAVPVHIPPTRAGPHTGSGTLPDQGSTRVAGNHSFRTIDLGLTMSPSRSPP